MNTAVDEELFVADDTQSSPQEMSYPEAQEATSLLLIPQKNLRNNVQFFLFLLHFQFFRPDKFFENSNDDISDCQVRPAPWRINGEGEQSVCRTI